MNPSLEICIIGLSITSSWGNGHATTYRGLVRELNRLGHRVFFLEWNAPWYAGNRDMPRSLYCDIALYETTEELFEQYVDAVRGADLVIVGSYVHDGVTVAEWVIENARNVTAFYDIDTPVTLAKLERGDYEYLNPDIIPGFDLYLSFTGGPTLKKLEEQYGAHRAVPLYCSVDPFLYYKKDSEVKWDLGYLGTYSEDRQPGLERLLLEPARRTPNRRFVVAGPQYPEGVHWPRNVERIHHLPPANHLDFYNQQRFTLNITRDDMRAAGYSPSVRLFEAAACGVPIITDKWPGLETFFELGTEIFPAETSEEALNILYGLSMEKREAAAARIRERVLAEHTAAHRARELINYYREAQVEPAM